MSAAQRSSALSGLARLGFSRLSAAAALLDEVAASTGVDRSRLKADAALAADPDAALDGIALIARRDAAAVRAILDGAGSRRALWALLGASHGFADFFLRHPDQLDVLAEPSSTLPTRERLTDELLAAVGAADGFAAASDDSARIALRVRYRRMLALIATYDLLSDDPAAIVPQVSATLADAAAAALEASLAVARARVAAGPFPRDQVAAVKLSIIGMGKTGARELNYVSDVDVIFVAGADEAADPDIDQSRVIDIATRLAVQTMRGISEVESEPALWEVDANLRPEGKQGALVRTLDSHLSYYDRWAKSWEFQALLKARWIAGDEQLGRDYVAGVQPKIWTSAAREDFVDSVQRMRERVTENLPDDEVDHQLKLGPGGIRDIEFTVQLLQLVHGVVDTAIRQRGTLEALDALVTGGYIGRADAAAFAEDYRRLRVLEHRVQLVGLRRTHLMPADEHGLRVLARASRLASSGDELRLQWEGLKREVRDIHVRIFYRPLLSAVAALPQDEQALSPTQAQDRLAAIGFRDPAGALRHIGALTGGVSRKATIQRHLMPVMIRWFAEGVDPDYGLIAFRRISERLGTTPWFLRMMRDSSGAAERLTRVLSGSRYVGELMEWIPESVAWLDSEGPLRPRTPEALHEEARALRGRAPHIDDAMRAVRALRRRELLRTAMGAMLGVLDIHEVATALTTITDITIQSALAAVRREVVSEEDEAFEFAVIGMGRYGGAELGFGSDADVMFVYDPNGIDEQRAHEMALRLVTELRRHAEDQRAPLELDADLRPEGRNGPMARSIDAYAEYYRRWSVAWETQALLRARPVAGSDALLERFMSLADAVRYPEHPDERAIREIKRIKARVENERLPQGTDPSRHLKLGPGALSDVEWIVQLWQIEHAHAVPGLRTTSTLSALEAAQDARLVMDAAATRLREAWLLASRLRSANTLLSGRTSDVLPWDRQQLDGIGRILGLPAGSATPLEEEWLRTARRARRAFEKLFYG